MEMSADGVATRVKRDYLACFRLYFAFGLLPKIASLSRLPAIARRSSHA
jgi:hypothetical protein